MVAVTNGVKDKNLQFKNACGYLKLKLYNTDGLTVKRIVLEGNNGEKIAGSAKISFDDKGKPTCTITGETKEITLNCGDNGVALGNSTDNATEFRFVVPPMEFTQGFTVTIFDNDDNEITKSTTKKFTITKNTFTNMTAFEVKVDPHKYVDLGLPSGTLWATMNIGAENPEGDGDYFAWGETTTVDENKSGFSWSTYKFTSNLTKYNSTDKITKLESADDAATANWGSTWRIPTKADFDELRSECTWEKSTQNGKEGYKIISKSDANKFIFIPSAGYYDDRNSLNDKNSIGYYWISEICDNESYDLKYAYYYYLNPNWDKDTESDFNLRCMGLSIRPVRSK